MVDIYDSEGSTRHDMTTAVEDINRHLEENASDIAQPSHGEADKAKVADEESPPALEEDDDKHWGFIMDWGPY